MKNLPPPLNLYPHERFTYWANTKEKRVFLLVDAPYGYIQKEELLRLKIQLIEWGSNKVVNLTALDFLALTETKKLIPYTPKYS